MEESERRLRNVCASSLDPGFSSAKLTPQKFSCKSTDSTPACISLGASWRTQMIRNLAFFCPRCKSTIVPGCSFARSAPKRAPNRVISSVCAKRDSFATENLTGRTIFCRAILRFSTIESLDYAFGWAELKRYLRERLPSQFVPSRVKFVAALAYTASGKVDRAATQRAAADYDSKGTDQ